MSKLLRERDLAAKGLDYTPRTIRRLEAEGLFPRRVKLSERKSVWVESEIDDHLAKLVAARG